MQQNPPLTPQEREKRADFFGYWSDEYQRIGNMAAITGNRHAALTYEIASGVAGLLEQAYRPSLGGDAVDVSLDFAAKTYSEMTGVPRLIVDEVVRTQIQPRLEPLKGSIDQKLGYKK